MSDPAPGWAEVVYGRTRTADFWWRAVPEWTVRHGWLSDVVGAVLGGGHGLAGGPRFLLARGPAGTLAGVGCRARELDDVMHTDGRRPLFCFVGWLCPPGEGPAAVPGFDAWQERFAEWAAPVYRRWMAPAWDEHPSRLREPAVSVTAPAPWADPGPPAGPPTDSRADSPVAEPLEGLPGAIRLHPAASGARVWARAAVPSGPVVLTTGWRAYRDGVTRVVTDVCADDVDESTPDTVDRPAPARTPPPPPRQEPPPEPEQVPDAPHDPDPRRPDLCEEAGNLVTAPFQFLCRTGRAALDAVLPGHGDDQPPHGDDRRPLDDGRGTHESDRRPHGTEHATAESGAGRGRRWAAPKRGRPRADDEPRSRRAGRPSRSRRGERQIEIDRAADPQPPREPPAWVTGTAAPARTAGPGRAADPAEPDPRPEGHAHPGGDAGPDHRPAGDTGPDRRAGNRTEPPGTHRPVPPPPPASSRLFRDRREVGPDDEDDGTFDEF